MTLDDIKNVIIDYCGGYKFIVASISDRQSKKLVVRANAQCSYHRDILDLLRASIPGFRVSCIGGGRIDINPNTKSIKIWGSSGDFGVEPNRSETVRILKETHPDFEVIASGERW